MIALVDDAYTQGVSALDNPLLDTDGSLTAEGDNLAWFTPTPLSAWWILHDIEAIVLGDAQWPP